MRSDYEKHDFAEKKHPHVSIWELLDDFLLGTTQRFSFWGLLSDFFEWQQLKKKFLRQNSTDAVHRVDQNTTGAPHHNAMKSTSENGDVYEGDWKDNKKNGKGKYTLAYGGV